jgi:hypothetical protein
MSHAEESPTLAATMRPAGKLGESRYQALGGGRAVTSAARLIVFSSIATTWDRRRPGIIGAFRVRSVKRPILVARPVVRGPPNHC